MNIYKLLKINRLIKNHRIKFFGLFLLHKLGKRYLAVNLDPVLACNLRCKMCYFTDTEYVKKMKGQFKKEELNLVAKAIFGRALKLQIGCGTEPTLYKNLAELVQLGNDYRVPYLSLTTNANLLTYEKIESLLKAGLNEFTISLHGVYKESYEDFMGKGDYEKFHSAFNAFQKLKQKYDFKVRINYTFNVDNFYEVKDIFKYFNPESFDILQIRPIKKLGNTEYQNFDISPLAKDYPEVIYKLKTVCKANEIILMAPENLSLLEKENPSSFIYDYTFCYVSPRSFWKRGFDWKNQSFEEFSNSIGWGRTLFQNIFKSKKELTSLKNSLNYEIDIN